ncbi:hypothetical protein P9112_014124 [Eukaryota sp. TZLM1-RC]
MPRQPLNSSLIHKTSDTEYIIDEGFVPNMNTKARLLVNEALSAGVFEELRHAQQETGGGFLPAVQQLANVSSLPGLVGMPVALPDVHSGYGFPIGGVAAFDLDDPNAVICPGGIGFDINCGVRLIATNLRSKDFKIVKDDLADVLFGNVPVGVGTGGAIKLNDQDLNAILNNGVDWAIEKGYAWPEDKQVCEELGNMSSANSQHVSQRAKKRGKGQIGTLGAGNHYLEIQVVDEIFDEETARVFGLERDQICVMIHCGSRGLGHQVATDYLQEMEREVKNEGIRLNDRQLAAVKFSSSAGQRYFAAMSAAANYAWTNRQVITHIVRQSFEQVYGKSAREMGMRLVYDVSHNIAKVEQMDINGVSKRILVHRKGATRALPAGHELVPSVYRNVGHPVLVGGTMSDASYCLAGQPQGHVTFYSSCHGAGRALSRHEARRTLTGPSVLEAMKRKGILIRVATPKLVMEEASESYKSVDAVVETCHQADITRMVAKLRPLAVIKG